MEEYMILGLKEENKYNGFYIDDKEGKKVLREGGLSITIELWKHLLNIGLFKFNGTKEDRIYTIDDKGLFETFKLPIDDTPQPKSELELLKEKVAIQEQTILELSAMLGGM